jgi:hypothetical protein
MKYSTYSTWIKKVRVLLEKDWLFSNSWWFNVSRSFIESSKKNEPYFKLYKIWIEGLNYHYLLQDSSFIQFDCTKDDDNEITSLRYWFYQNPYYFYSYDDYIDGLIKENLIDPTEEIGDMLISEYEQFLSEQDLNYNSIYFRYDFNPKQYVTSSHPTSHFHFWNHKTLRIPSWKLLTPEIFILFVIKQVYIQQWNDNLGFYIAELSRCKLQCDNLDISLFCENEKNEIYLS